MFAKVIRLATTLLVGLGASAAAWSQQPFADASCPEYDQFVQEYEFVGEMGALRDFRLCPGSQIGGPPEFPMRRVRVRIEYLQGDYFVHQETREWHWDPGPDGCALVVPRVVQAYRMRIGQEEETALIAPDKVRYSRNGEKVPNTLVAGTAQARTPRSPELTLEDTAFGIQCLRGNSVGLTGQACLAALPKKCKSELYMAPLDLQGNIPGMPFRGRTTSLEFGSQAGVDRSQWNIP